MQEAESPNLASFKGSGVPRHLSLTPPGTWSLAPVRAVLALDSSQLPSPPLPFLPGLCIINSIQACDLESGFGLAT